MRRRPDVERLREVSRIRNVQRAAAEAQAVRADSALREREAARDAEQAARHVVQTEWAEALARSDLRVETMGLWVADFAHSDARLHAAADAIAAATAERRRRLDAWRTALHRHDVARDAERAAARDKAEHLAEAALQDASDLFLQRRGAG